MQAPKNGFFYVIDRATGELISAENIVPINWAKGVDLKTGRPIVDDEAAAYWKGEKKAKLVSRASGVRMTGTLCPITNTGLVYIPAHIMSARYEHVPDAPARNKFRACTSWVLRPG